MKKHKGEIIEKATRSSGYTLKEVAKRMKISRSTLYNRFKDIDINDDFILLLSKVIHHDFSNEFPHLKGYFEHEKVEEGKGFYEKLTLQDSLLIQKKYYQILEKYNQLLKMVIKITSVKKEDFPRIKKDIIYFIEENITI